MSSTKEKPDPIIFGDEELSDVTLVVDNQDFKTNKMFLACRSEVFKAMFYGDFKESKEDRVEIKDVSVQNFRRFLEIIYTGKTTDPLNFLEFPFYGNQHSWVEIISEEAEPRVERPFIYTPSYEKLFYNFWNDIREILNIADRFNLSPMVMDYFGYLITIAIGRCTKTDGCHQCFNSLIFALINGIDVSKCTRKHESVYYTTWISYAIADPFPETISVKVMNTIFQQFIE